MPEKREDIRKDLMRRWFAVAISVGFASALIQMGWVNDGRLPTAPEWQQLCRLAVALTAVILSWEGYFFSIETKPLKDSGRFFLDFILVLLYMVLLYTSKLPNFWLFIHSVAFLIYITWDILSIHQYRSNYAFVPAPPNATVLQIYTGGLLGKEGYYRGPIITITWALYFIALASLQLIFRTFDAFIFAPFALVGLINYRHDKTCASAKLKDGISKQKGMSYRISRIFLLVSGAISVIYAAKVLSSYPW
jgi:hypothetical protein